MTDHHEDGPADETDATDERARAGRSSDRLANMANLLAIVVGLAAIGLAVWQGFENRRFYRLSVLPHLEPNEASWSSAEPISSDYFLLPEDADSVYAVGYSVENTGLGPAVLRNLLVYRDGEAVFDAAESGGRYVFSEMKADLDRLPFPTLKLNMGYSAGELLAEDEVHHVITVAVPVRAVGDTAVDRPVASLITDVLESYSVVFCYCSVYGSDCAMTYVGSAPPADRACRF